jgi:gliding motility-associated-like protein
MANANEGAYTVVVASGNCTTQPSNAAAVDVTNALTGTPALTASATQLCSGESFMLNSSTLNVANASYQWFFNGQLLATTTVPSYAINDATAANAGSYSVVIASGNCTTQPSNVAQVAITNMSGTALQLAASDDQLCEGQMLTLNSSAAADNDMQYQWYFDNGNGSVLLATTDVPTYFVGNASAANVGTYSVIASNGNCATPPSNLEAVQLVAAPTLLAETTTDLGSPACRGDLVQLNVTPVQGATYQWSGPQGFAASTANPVLPSATAGQAGVYTATLNIEGCSFTAAPVTVHVFTGIDAENDVYEVNFNESLKDVVLAFNDLPGNVTDWFINIVEAPKNGTATVTDGLLSYTPRRNFFGPDELVYEICNADCPDDCDRATVRINVLGTSENNVCFAPNIITPNGDGRNDNFEVPCLETTYTNNNVKVFNRWGDRVFDQDAYQNNWDGRYKGNPLPPGTYFYLIQLDKGNSEECLQGYFTITR